MDNRELSLFGRVAASLRGPSRWIVLFVFGAMAAFLVLFVVAVLQLATVEGVRAMIAWAAVLNGCLIGLAALKIWYWMELNRIAILHSLSSKGAKPSGSA